MEFRELRETETGLLQDFLYEAIFIPAGVEPPPREIIKQPELKIYYEDFGREGEGIVSIWICSECGAEHEVYISCGEEGQTAE